MSLALETWADTRRRLSFSPDLLIEHLLVSPRVERLVVADPWRSVLGMLRQDKGPRFPGSDGRVLVRPRRWRRSDPYDPASLERWAHRYLRQLRRTAASHGLDRPVLIATHPIVAAAADSADWANVVYYGWDDWAAHPSYRLWWPAFERAYGEIRQRGHRVVGVSSRIVERIGTDGRSAVVPNGLRPEEWLVPVPAPEWFMSLPKPRLLYTGTLDARLDVDLIRTLAAEYPHGSLVFVGSPADDAVVAALTAISNVTVRPWQPRTTVRGLTFACDAALLPHVASPLTIAMSPLKVYEYLAAGRPVIAVDLEPVHDIPAVLRSRGVDEFVANVRAGLARGSMPEVERLRFIEENSWTTRFERLLDVAL